MDAQSPELIRFREQWKTEVRQRTNHVPSSATPDISFDTPPPCPPVRPALGSSEEFPVSAKAHPSPSLAHTHHSSHFSKTLSSAVATYRRAIEHEQAGDLDGALHLYRNAFRLDSNVDKAYRREEQRLQAAVLNESSCAIKHRHVSSALLEDGVVPPKESSKAITMLQKRSDARTLVHLVSSFPRDLTFEPMDESGDVPLRRLPDEIIVLILKTMDPLSIERFAMLGRKARVLSLDSAIWRFLVQKTYIPPQVPGDINIDALAEQYTFDYRQLFIEHPRLRLDGVYIAVCHYVRPGLNNDNAWVHVSHLITYHRYLRFFANGTVISLLANEDVEPQTIVPLLKSSLRMKGLFIGNWTLEGTTILIRDLTDPTGSNARYTFQMTLNLRSRPFGRWNRLDFAGYESVNVENGETVPFALKHERPFWFSKVLSYVV